MGDNHFTATGIVLNRNNEVLMIHHNKLKVWLPPGGHVEQNELPDEAVLREVCEETGVRARLIPMGHGLSLTDEHCRELCTPFTVLLENIAGDWSHNHIDLVYLCRAEDERLTPAKNEVHGIGWFSFDAARGLETYQNVSRTLQCVEAYLNAHPDL